MKPVPSLVPLSWLYGTGVAVRNLFFETKILRSERVSVPVISVGNISSGGTGKTPVVETIARLLLDEKRKVAIISRGYNRRTHGYLQVSDGVSLTATAEDGGDEPVLLARKLPGAVVLVDEHRSRAAHVAVERFHADVIVLDDGFQHRNLQRDLDIVLVDALESPFTMPMLPAGNRREPLGSLKRADAVVITKINGGADVPRMQRRLSEYTKAAQFTSSYNPSVFKRARTGFSVNLQSVKGKKAVAFCGIARPENFWKTLDGLGIEMVDFVPFNDHHFFSMPEMEAIVGHFKRRNADYIITTEKDYSRLSSSGIQELFSDQPLFCIEMKMEIHQEKEWKKLIASVLRK